MFFAHERYRQRSAQLLLWTMCRASFSFTMCGARVPLHFASARVAIPMLAVSHDVQVTFLYPSRPNQTILKGLNLTLPARKLTCIMGPSGCGKSTVMSMLMRLYEPLTGKITLDGVDITRISVPFLRSIIGLVQQEPVCFFSVFGFVSCAMPIVFADFVFLES